MLICTSLIFRRLLNSPRQEVDRKQERDAVGQTNTAGGAVKRTSNDRLIIMTIAQMTDFRPSARK